MDRRKFLLNTLKMGMAPVAMQGLPFRSMTSSMIPASACDVSDRCMVIVYLNGGNDILNTTVPLNQMSAYVNARPTLNIPQSQLITLDSSLPDAQQMGLHPNLTGLKSIYDGGKLSIVQRVSYPVPNRSHFASTDNMLRGVDGVTQDAEGWIARYFKDRFPNYKGAPTSQNPDPLGLLFNAPNTGFHTEAEHAWELNLTDQDPGGFFSLVTSLSGAPILNFPASEYGDMLQYLTSVEYSSNFYSERISNVFNNGSNAISYANNNFLNPALKTVARLISGGSRTKIFMVQHSGYDTHVFQAQTHNNLLGMLGSSLQTFQNDLQALGIADQVMTVVFSEFGRKIIENGNQGTDHGTLSSMFMVGNGVNPGVIGDNINLSNIDEQGAPDPSDLENDYRKVLATLLQDWLGANTNSIQATFHNSQFVADKPDIVNTNFKADASCYVEPEPAQLEVCEGTSPKYQIIDENGNCIEVDCLDDIPNGQDFVVLDDNAYLTPLDEPKIFAKDSIRAEGNLDNMISGKLQMKAGKSVRLGKGFRSNGRKIEVRIKDCN